MSENSQKNGIGEKLKNTKINRATIAATAILVVALAIIVSVTVATNRSKKKNEPTDDTTDTKPITDTTDQTPPENEDKEPEQTNPTTPQKPDSGSSQVENKLPSFILPVSGALSKKHDSELQVYSTTMNDYRVHLGVDIVTEENAPVYAAADGVVSKIWNDVKMGYCMAVSHSGNCYTIYKNLSETIPEGIKEGVSVRSGQLIGSVGESAMIEVAEEPHLHFEMTINDLSVDPLEYFNEKSLESLSIDASYGE